MNEGDTSKTVKTGKKITLYF